MHRILVVDGHRAIVESLVRAFAPDFQLVYARTAFHAMEALKKRIPNAVIQEYLLPDVSGMDLLRKLRTRFPHLPVFITSRYNFDWVRNSVLQAGALGFFTKPLAGHRIRRAIEAAVSRVPVVPRKRDGWELRDADRELITYVTSFIDKHYSQKIRLTELAARLGINIFTLCRKFKAAQKVSFRQYLARVRISRAQELLSVGGYSMTDIAQMVGYSDLPRFDKVFKRITTSSPSSYRSAALMIVPRQQITSGGD